MILPGSVDVRRQTRRRVAALERQRKQGGGDIPSAADGTGEARPPAVKDKDHYNLHLYKIDAMNPATLKQQLRTVCKCVGVGVNFPRHAVNTNLNNLCSRSRLYEFIWAHMGAPMCLAIIVDAFGMNAHRYPLSMCVQRTVHTVRHIMLPPHVSPRALRITACANGVDGALEKIRQVLATVVPMQRFIDAVKTTVLGSSIDATMPLGWEMCQRLVLERLRTQAELLASNSTVVGDRDVLVHAATAFLHEAGVRGVDPKASAAELCEHLRHLGRAHRELQVDSVTRGCLFFGQSGLVASGV